MDEILEDKKANEKKYLQNRFVLNLHDNFEIDTIKGFIRLNNLISETFKTDPLKYSIIEWHETVNQLNKRNAQNVR